MKSIFLIVLMGIFALPAYAVNLTFGWDSAPPGQVWDEVRLYMKGDAGYTLMGSVPGSETQITVDVPAASLTYVVRSYSKFYKQESIDSNEVGTPEGPIPPVNFKILAVIGAAILALIFLFGKFFK